MIRWNDPWTILLGALWAIVVALLIWMVSGCGGEQPTKVVVEKPTPVNVKVTAPDEIAVKQPIKVVPITLTAGGLVMTITDIWWGHGSVWGMERLWIAGQLENRSDSPMKFVDVFVKVDGKGVGIYTMLVPGTLKPGNVYYFYVATEDIGYKLTASYDIQFVFK